MKSRHLTLNIVHPAAIPLTVAALLIPAQIRCQSVPEISGQPATIRVHSGRPLADTLDGVQKVFISPVAYEEAPYESASDLRQIPIVTGAGLRVESSRPSVAFSVTLSASDSTAYLAAQTVLYNYTNAGLPGVYQAVQKNGWVNVVPVRVASAGGSICDVTPVMSQRVTFPRAVRDARATIDLIASQISQESGVRVKVLNVPFMNGATLEMGASNEPAADAIATDIAALMGRQVSFRCLWEPTEKDYYLSVEIVTPPNPYKGPPPPRILHPTLQPGPSTNNPWFNKAPK